MAQHLEAEGIQMVPVGMNFRDLSEPTKELIRLVLTRKLQHTSPPPMRWMIDNLMGEHDVMGNVKPSKKKSTEKIDGIVSLIMALGRAIVRPKEEEGAYAGRDLIVL